MYISFVKVMCFRIILPILLLFPLALRAQWEWEEEARPALYLHSLECALTSGYAADLGESEKGDLSLQGFKAWVDFLRLGSGFFGLGLGYSELNTKRSGLANQKYERSLSYFSSHYNHNFYEILPGPLPNFYARAALLFPIGGRLKITDNSPQLSREESVYYDVEFAGPGFSLGLGLQSSLLQLLVPNKNFGWGLEFYYTLLPYTAVNRHFDDKGTKVKAQEYGAAVTLRVKL